MSDRMLNHQSQPVSHLALLLSKIAPGQRGAFVQEAVSFRSSGSLDRSFSVGPIRAAFSNFWESRFRAPMPVQELRKCVEAPIPIGTVLEFSKLNVTRAPEEIEEGIDRLVTYLSARIHQESRPLQQTFSAPVNGAMTQSAVTSGSEATISQLGDLHADHGALSIVPRTSGSSQPLVDLAPLDGVSPEQHKLGCELRALVKLTVSTAVLVGGRIVYDLEKSLSSIGKARGRSSRLAHLAAYYCPGIEWRTLQRWGRAYRLVQPFIDEGITSPCRHSTAAWLDRIQLTALYQLCARNVAEGVRLQAIESAKEGNFIDGDEVKKLLNQNHSAAANSGPSSSAVVIDVNGLAQESCEVRNATIYSKRIETKSPDDTIPSSKDDTLRATARTEESSEEGSAGSSSATIFAKDISLLAGFVLIRTNHDDFKQALTEAIWALDEEAAALAASSPFLTRSSTNHP